MGGVNGSPARGRGAAAAPRPRPAGGNRKPADPRVARLFNALRAAGSETVSATALRNALEAAGLMPDDPRLRDTLGNLERLRPPAAETELDAARFEEVISSNILLTERALQGALVIPEFDAFAGTIRGIFEAVAANRGGKVADYIPQLGRVNPERLAVSLCTVDGQRLDLGDAAEPFCLQSTSKPVNYCLALEEHGEEAVHRHIGREPSGRSFNELTLNAGGLPHNPMINAGAIMSSSLIRMGADASDRFDHVMDTWTRLMGGQRPGFSNAVYLSERQTADRNFALGYSMREHGAFPADADLLETLEFYFQCCSIEVTTRAMAVMAGTLANGGVCPTTDERVFRPETVQKCLSLMSSCGMYDFSGEWAFAIGLPAKSGVSGAVVVIVPNLLGLVIWSPRLDEHGNSVRGIDFARQLVGTFSFHVYDDLAGHDTRKRDPRRARDAAHDDEAVALCWAASKGDLTAIRRFLARGADLDAADYDGRTPLHLAAAEGHEDVVGFLLAQGVAPGPRDRWGATPRDDADRSGHTGIVKMIGGAGEPGGEDAGGAPPGSRG